MNRPLIISLATFGIVIVSSMATQMIIGGVAEAQTPTATEAMLDSQVSRRVKGEIYYDIDFSTDKISRGKEKRFKITVTAINTKTGEVDKNPFQRVKLTALPIGVSKTDSGNTSWTPSGTFSENTNSIYAEQISGYSIQHVVTAAGMRPVSSFDLIDGTAEVSFSLTQTPADDNYVGFMVTPTTWPIAPGIQSAKAYRLSLQTPRQPANHHFLYKEWQVDDAMAEHVFTIATLPVDNAPRQSMTELGTYESEESVIDQPQNETTQNTVIPPAANLTQPEYNGTSATNLRLRFWLWVVGGAIVLTIAALSWLSLKKRSQKVK
ncbi:MAG: hypothetical protein WC400_02585 [Patescibacteria group bacterium]|jgi:hypothetical protein